MTKVSLFKLVFKVFMFNFINELKVKDIYSFKTLALKVIIKIFLKSFIILA